MEIVPEYQTEVHPWEPYVPDGAKALFVGTFPPGRHRWAMEFFYPNPANDFWRIMGLVYGGGTDTFYNSRTRSFSLEAIQDMLEKHGVAVGDTGYKVRRLRGNASDKYLEIVQPVDLEALMRKMPGCRAIAATGEKAASVLASLTATSVPRMGENVSWIRSDGRVVELWRLPSTSRAFPMAASEKAEFYRAFLESAGCL